MSLIVGIDKSVNKRFKSENKYKDEEKSAKENVRHTAQVDRFSQKTEQKDDKELTIRNNEILEAIDSDDDSFVFPPDEDISEMLNEVQYNGYFPTVTDRYFTKYYKMDVQSPGDDICIRIHSNRICMLSLAPSHVILQDNRDIKSIDFKVSEKLDRARNKVSGKSKHGAQPLQANSNICTISCSDEQTYLIKCCMTGKLVEINEVLLEKPQLLREPPHKGGYLAIILPNIKLLENLKQSLLTNEQYVELVKKKDSI